ncbi:MAG: hypothetical protein M1825_003864 [Sarcosagium campestre]|nr:MAG: hypothetical protein M1825_003864 [Sarcosagium campestre]
MKGLLSLLSLTTGFIVLVASDRRHATADASSTTARDPATETSRLLRARSGVVQSHADNLVQQQRQPSELQLEHQQQRNRSVAPLRRFEVIYDRLLHDRGEYSLQPRFFAHSAVVFHATTQDGDLRIDLSTSPAPDGSPYVVRALDYNNAGENPAEQRRLRRLPPLRTPLRWPLGSVLGSASASASPSNPASTPVIAFQDRSPLPASQPTRSSSSSSIPTSGLDQDDAQSPQQQEQQHGQHEEQTDGNVEEESENDRPSALAQMWQSPPRTLHGTGYGSRRSRPGQARMQGRPLPNRQLYRGGVTRLTNAEIVYEIVPQAWMMADPLYNPDEPNTCHNLTLNVVAAVLSRDSSNSSDYTVPNALSDVLAEGNALEIFRLDRSVSIVKYLYYDRIERWSTDSRGEFIFRSVFDISDPAGLQLTNRWFVDRHIGQSV